MPEMKNQALSFLMGPPKVPPKRLSTYFGFTTALQPSGAGAQMVAVPAATPGGQKPWKGLFSS